ncbi:hypothetical protein J2S92_003834 [Arthrobacter bambusae]|nr:hypothetical protein [Arthrobacter bambusae]MDQ0237420.1 hypothetical protein [Arthrobacter bambusae]
MSSALPSTKNPEIPRISKPTQGIGRQRNVPSREKRSGVRISLAPQKRQAKGGAMRPSLVCLTGRKPIHDSLGLSISRTGGYCFLVFACFGGASWVPLPQVEEFRACEDRGVEARGECERWGGPVPGDEVHDRPYDEPSENPRNGSLVCDLQLEPPAGTELRCPGLSEGSASGRASDHQRRDMAGAPRCRWDSPGIEVPA